MARVATASSRQMRIESVLDEDEKDAAASGVGRGISSFPNDDRENDDRDAPWHFLYFLPLPHGHGALRPSFGSAYIEAVSISAMKARSAARKNARDLWDPGHFVFT